MKTKHILNHFQKNDPIIFEVLSTMDLEPLSPKTEFPFFHYLVRAIAGQQLSVKAAATIYGRLAELLKNKITAESILNTPDQALRDVGLSWGKVKYLNSLAEHIQDKSLNLENLVELSNQEVITALTQVKGIGQWTAEMFLLFTLGREDVYSHGDLGLKKGITKLYNLKEYTPQLAEKIISKWGSLKSYGSLALWHSLDNE